MFVNHFLSNIIILFIDKTIKGQREEWRLFDWNNSTPLRIHVIEIRKNWYSMKISGKLVKFTLILSTEKNQCYEIVVLKETSDKNFLAWRIWSDILLFFTIILLYRRTSSDRMGGSQCLEAPIVVLTSEAKSSDICSAIVYIVYIEKYCRATFLGAFVRMSLGRKIPYNGRWFLRAPNCSSRFNVIVVMTF